MGIRMKGNPDSGYTTDDGSDGYTTDASFNPRAPARTSQASQGGSVFSEDVLKIEICGPSVDYLTVIDVPGIFRTPTEGVTTKEDMAMVKNMVRWYIQDSRTVILAVLPSNIDISNQEILTMAEEYDKNGERTLGILTKPDLVTERSAMASVCNIVRGKKKQLTLGYYLVRSRGADQDDTDFGRREDLFKQDPWSSLPPERVGVKALKARLAELLGHMARREFPKLRKDINEMLQAAEREQNALGPSRKDEHEQRRFLSGIAGRFQDQVRQALEAQYAGDAAFENSIELRLVTQIVNLADAFNEEFEKMAALREFATIAEDEEEHEDDDEHGLLTDPSTNSILKFAQDIEPEDFPELDNIISHEFEVSEPGGGIIRWIGGLYARSRAMDLGTFSSAVWASAWREQSSKWPGMSKTFMTRVIVAIHRFITAALHEVCVDTNVRDELWSAILDELLRRYEAGMTAADFLVSAERDAKPYTLDYHFNENRQRSRGERIAERLKRISIDDNDRNLVTIAQVQSATEKKSNIEDVVEKLHDDLSAYYDIARKRFVDNVLNQAVNYRLLFGPSTPLGVFSQDWVIGLRPDQLDAIAGESPSIREYRERLARKITDLTAAKEILRQ
jgi:hypothetical protein